MTAVATQFTGYAGTAPHTDLVPWSYTPRPLGQEDVELEIECCGICGADLHTLNSGWGPTAYPIIVGHEIVGKVIAKGDKVTDLQIGQRVGVGAQAFACLNKETCADCRVGQNNCCSKMMLTNGGVYSDGAKSQGGYASHIRVLAAFAFPIPANLPSDKVAPLLCAGVTVFTALSRHGAKPGVKVGILGIGGLGHLGLKFASAMGAEVTAVSSSDSKRAEATRLGAHHFVNSSNKEEVAAAKYSLDFLLVTSFQNADWGFYLDFLKTGGKLVMVGLPESNITIHAFQFIPRHLSIVGSMIGSTEDMKRCLAFASEHNITADVAKYPMSQCNEALKVVADNKARYRVVLENKPLSYN